MSVLWIDSINANYPHKVATDEFDDSLQARIDYWLFSRPEIEFQDYYEDLLGTRCYCFKEPQWATMFKLTFGGK